MKITHPAKNALTIIIGVLAFWPVGICVASVLSFFELPVVSFGPNHALRVCALCAFWQPIGLQRDRVCFGFTRLGVCLLFCACCLLAMGQQSLACWRVCPKMINESSVSVSSQPVKFSGKYAGISTDVFAFLTTLCGITPEVATKVANDAASSVGRAMAGVTTDVSFGRMSKDALATIKETSQRKGVSVNEFPLQVAYLAEKTRKFCFDNRIKVSNVELPEPLRHYLLDCAK